jgi:hypothetical protein
VKVSEASAQEARRQAAELDQPKAWKVAEVAVTAARQARRLIDERNHAYTFHADPSFSFGEGWYVAAAAVLAHVPIQIEPDKPHTAQAEFFLRQAGLSPRLVPYRSRPRANKALPAIIAHAFRQDRASAQALLRGAFLGNEPVSGGIVHYADQRLAVAPTRKKILVWVRQGIHHPTRNTKASELVELCRSATESGLTPLLVGDAFVGGETPPAAVDLTLFWKEAIFQGRDMRRAQLQLFEVLKDKHGLVGQLGVTSAGMDGPALMGLPTLYVTEQPNVRLGLWVGAVPGYEEVVRSDGYFDQISNTLQTWSAP